jgi:hypothetical protein
METAKAMTLTTPIAAQLYSDPIAAYSQITAGLAPNERWAQPFDYSIKEIPTLTKTKPLEEIFPDSPILSTDKDLDSWEISQGGFAICGSFGNLCAFASVPRHLPIALENAIYPQEKSPFGLYMVRVVNPSNLSAFTWVAIDSLMPVTETGKLPFSWIVKGQAVVQTLLLKAMATMRGGSFDELSNSRQFGIKFTGWFPHTLEETSSFATFKAAFDKGCLANFTFAQQYDTAGAKITPAGIFYGHDYAIADYFETADGHQAVRIENPHGTTAKDWVGIYDDGAPFWTEHPELASKLADAKQGGGNWWMPWHVFVAMASNGVVKLRAWTGEGFEEAIA